MARDRDDRDGRRGRKLGAAAATLFACLALGVRAATASDPVTSQVEIRNFRFDPPTLVVPAGTTVTWINHDEEVHSLVAADGDFSSPGIDGDQQFSHRFEKAGTYEYHCGLHPQMKGTVVVR